MRTLLLALPLLLMQPPSVHAQVSLGLGINLPGVSIGINLPAYPDLQRVPGFPVYYAPQAQANFFFYDGLYWVFEGDDWYSSSWYNGPWRRIGPDAVPVYLLRVPVRYYRQPPGFFGGWNAGAAPRWGDHWGGEWAQRRQGWDRWNRSAAPPPAPLPVYQRKYPQSRYPHEEGQQQNIRSESYRYQPRDPVARQQWQPRPAAPEPQHPQAGRPDTDRGEPSRGNPGKGHQAPGRPGDDRNDERDSRGRGGR